MKNVLFLSLCLLPLMASAEQVNGSFLDDGKTWTYRNYNDMTQKSFNESLTICGDTIVGNKPYKKIYRSDDKGTPLLSSGYMLAMREDGRQVYARYPNGNEEMLYDFGLTTGDSYVVRQDSDGAEMRIWEWIREREIE